MVSLDKIASLHIEFPLVVIYKNFVISYVLSYFENLTKKVKKITTLFMRFLRDIITQSLTHTSHKDRRIFIKMLDIFVRVTQFCPENVSRTGLNAKIFKICIT